MRSIANSIVAATGLCWAVYCGPYDSNTFPLAVGMTPQEASAALGLPLTHYSGARGAEIYIAGGSADVPGRFPVDALIELQFRRGHLTGWKQNWALPKPWIIY
ncbi:MAG TPA: hypothetical protein VKW08_10245 [Xanthobacteraceae bacterium]|nr:hypothetical protein [Xanthobacteraceae bacterium]